MPTYVVTDPETGMRIKLTGDAPPSEQDLKQIFSSVRPKQELPPATAGFIEAGMEDVPVSMNQMGKIGRGMIRPAFEGGGMVGGAMLGGIPGAGLGYGIGRQAANIVEGRPEPPLAQQTVEVGTDVLTGATMEAGGQVLSNAVMWVGRGLAKGARGLYESALKIPPSVPKKIRDAAVEVGLNGQWIPNEKSLGRLQTRIDFLNKKILETVKKGKMAGRPIRLDKALRYLDDLRGFYKNAPRRKHYLDQIDELEKEIIEDWGKRLPSETAQKMKQVLYRLHKKHYGEMRALEIEVDKTVARGLKEELVKKHPELAQLNAEDSALINLEEVLSRAVRRIRNYDIIRLGDMIMTTTGGVLGGVPGAAAAGGMKRVLEAPTVKSKLAFALWKARHAGGLYTSARAVTYAGLKGGEPERTRPEITR